MIYTMKQEKFYFPYLKEAISNKGLTFEEFKREAFNISTSPSSKSWSLSMKKTHGLTPSYINKAKKIIEALEFNADICKYEKCN